VLSHYWLTASQIDRQECKIPNPCLDAKNLRLPGPSKFELTMKAEELKPKPAPLIPLPMDVP